MTPAELAGFGERAIASIAVDLQDTLEALEMSDRTLWQCACNALNQRPRASQILRSDNQHRPNRPEESRRGTIGADAPGRVMSICAASRLHPSSASPHLIGSQTLESLLHRLPPGANG
jgi:hypothetical protein